MSCFFCMCTQGSGEEARAVPTDQTQDIKCGLLISSIGYKSLPIDPAVPFDPCTSTVPNEMGRVSQIAGKRKDIVSMKNRHFARVAPCQECGSVCQM